MGDRDTVATAGFLTCDRPATFRRSITSFAENAVAYGHQLEWDIVDDSRNAAAARANRETASLVARTTGQPVRYADRGDRAAYADLLAEKSGTPPEVCRFALLGDESVGPTHGAARNTLLLRSTGVRSMQIDDDLVCITSRIRGYTDEIGFAILGSKHHIPLAQREAADEYLEPADIDYFGEHGRVLGRRFGELIGMRRPANLDPQLWPDPEDPVMLSFTGVVGDAGMVDTSLRLRLAGITYDLLSSSPETYRRLATTHEIIYGTDRAAICRFPWDPMMNMGIDGRRLLPPFMPVLRAEETVFTAVLWRSRPMPVCAHLPFIVRHDREETRREQAWPLVKPSVGVSELLYRHIQALAPPFPEPGLNYIEPIGQYLLYQSQLPEDRFARWITREYTNYLTYLIEVAQGRLSEMSEAPDFWREGLQHYIADLKEKSTRPFTVYTGEGTKAEDPSRAYAALMHRIGEVLYHWTAMWEAAAELKSKGLAPAHPITPKLSLPL